MTNNTQQKKSLPTKVTTFAVSVPSKRRKASQLSFTTDLNVAITAVLLHPELYAGAQIRGNRTEFYFQVPEQDRSLRYEPSDPEKVRERSKQAIDIFGEESRSLILNALEHRIKQFKECDVWIKQAEQIISGLSEGILRDYYDCALQHERIKRSRILRHIRRLEECYDLAFKTTVFKRTVQPGHIDIQQLKEKIYLPDIASQHIELRRAGADKWKCLCIFHSEKSPSMMVYSDHYYCFGCQVSGDVFSFLQKIKGIGFKESLIEAGRYL